MNFGDIAQFHYRSFAKATFNLGKRLLDCLFTLACGSRHNCTASIHHRLILLTHWLSPFLYLYNVERVYHSHKYMSSSFWHPTRARFIAPLQVAPSFDSAAKGAFVGIFQVTSHREAARKAGDAHVERFQFLLDVIGGIFAFKIGIGGENDLTHVPFVHTFYKFFDTQIFHSDALNRRERSMQHVVQALVDTRFVQSQYIEWLLDYADHFLVPIRVTTDHTGIGFGDVEAARAIDNALFDAHDRFSQAACLVGRAA